MNNGAYCRSRKLSDVLLPTFFGSTHRDPGGIMQFILLTKQHADIFKHDAVVIKNQYFLHDQVDSSKNSANGLDK